MWIEYLVEGYRDTCWLTGLWSTPAKVKGTVLKAAWHWGSDSNVINVLLVEPGHTPLYVGILTARGSTGCDRLFFLHFVGELLSGDCD